jgi:hypothetical protein
LRDIEILKREGKLKYSGPAKGGYWQILKTDDGSGN